MNGKNEMAEDLGLNEREEFTGRSIILFKTEPDSNERQTADRLQSLLKNKAGIKEVVSSLDFTADGTNQSMPMANTITLPRLGMAVVSTPFEEATVLLREADDPNSEVDLVIPEKYDYLLEDNAVSGAESSPTLGGCADDLRTDPHAIRRLTKMLSLLSDVCEAIGKNETLTPSLTREIARFSDTTAATWGLTATRVTSSRFSGRGIRVAIIDTGLDLNHRDFRSRRITTRLFAPVGTSPRPTNTHGTHCAGTACGPRNPTSGPRYGIAYEAEIFALKVFNDDPRPGARRGDVIAAMDFANGAGCRILSLSLGSASNGAIDPEYERATTRLRQAGCLTIAAAGNEGRNGFRVGSPASSPDAVAVAAVDRNLRRADFSNFGPLDISGPGVEILSSVVGGGTRSLNGTSMATPHVAGIAALWLQSNPSWTPGQLETALRRTALQLSQPASHVGVGLVQAPQ